MEPITWLPKWIAEVLFWIYYNQTLIAGLTALAVGFITVRTLREYEFRYNRRSALGIEDEQRHNELLRMIGGKRLTYRRTGEAGLA